MIWDLKYDQGDFHVSGRKQSIDQQFIVEEMIMKLEKLTRPLLLLKKIQMNLNPLGIYIKLLYKKM